MLSEFDKEHVQEILDGHGDWFSAELMRFLAALPPSFRFIFAAEFPDEVEAVGDRTGTGRVLPWNYLKAKADLSNRRRLDAVDGTTRKDDDK